MQLGIEAGPTAPQYRAEGKGPSRYVTDPEGVEDLKGASNLKAFRWY